MPQEVLAPWGLLAEEDLAHRQAGALSPGALREVTVNMGKQRAPGGQGNLQDRPLPSRPSRNPQDLLAENSFWGAGVLRPKLRVHGRRQMGRAQGSLWVGEGAPKPVLEGQEVLGTGTGVLGDPRERRASRQGSPWARQEMALEPPRVPKGGQQVRGEQGWLAEERLRARILGTTRRPASAKPGASMGLECRRLVGEWAVPRWLGWRGLARRGMPEATG